MVQAVAALIEFCYLVRRSVIDDSTLTQIDQALERFHQHREIFRDLDIRPDGFSLPRQHSLSHYHFLITQFGAPNGLCSSITESKHIKAVKKPYRRSSRNKPLGQMLITNQRNDKLAAARVYFESHGMLDGPNVAGYLAQLLSESRTSSLGSAEVEDDMDEIESNQTTVDEPARSGLSEREGENDGDEGNEAGAVDEPLAEAEVKLAKTAGMWSLRQLCSRIF